jgi:glycerol-3-phosphate dehydrogenase (NAD(P)+)
LFWQETFNTKSFRVYTSDDIIGVEVGGALKNVIALAAGICDGLGYGDNTKAALMTRGLAEIKRLGIRFGANPSTFSGLSGIGDLMVTCMSHLSRNRGVGERIGKGETIDAILGSMQQVAEGVWTAKAAHKLIDELNIELPITAEVFAVLYENKNPREAVQSLMSRPPKPE